nr:unnamed protein product [Digitaria exilis]
MARRRVLLFLKPFDVFPPRPYAGAAASSPTPALSPPPPELRATNPKILDATLDGTRCPMELSRISVKLNGIQLPTYALNDILVSHPCPASVSRFSFRKIINTGESSHLINCRSSGLRVSTAAGSTAAMLSAGGFVMALSSRELQYMIREPISPTDADKPLLHGLVKPEQHMLVVWYNQEGAVYVDGSHVVHSIQHGDTLEISSNAPTLKVVLPEHLLKNAS